jgi:hypothetical protein
LTSTGWGRLVEPAVDSLQPTSAEWTIPNTSAPGQQLGQRAAEDQAGGGAEPGQRAIGGHRPRRLLALGEARMLGSAAMRIETSIRTSR